MRELANKMPLRAQARPGPAFKEYPYYFHIQITQQSYKIILKTHIFYDDFHRCIPKAPEGYPYIYIYILYIYIYTLAARATLKRRLAASWGLEIGLEIGLDWRMDWIGD